MGDLSRLLGRMSISTPTLHRTSSGTLGELAAWETEADSSSTGLLRHGWRFSMAMMPFIRSLSGIIRPFAPAPCVGKCLAPAVVPGDSQPARFRQRPAAVGADPRKRGRPFSSRGRSHSIRNVPGSDTAPGPRQIDGIVDEPARRCRDAEHRREAHTRCRIERNGVSWRPHLDDCPAVCGSEAAGGPRNPALPGRSSRPALSRSPWLS